MLRGLSSLLLLVPLAGCVLLVPSYEPGDHCTFEGDTECATCMRTSCQTQIDACCGVSACRASAYSFVGSAGSTMEAVDTCARGNPTTCANVFERATKTTAGEAVRVCVATTCRLQCAPNATATKWSCADARSADGACASCVYSKCDRKITECCEGGGCGSATGIEDDMSTCLDGDKRACSYRLDDAALTGTAGVLRKCIREECGSTCEGDGSTHRSCLLQNGGTYCSCSSAEEKSGNDCSASNVGGGRCYETVGGCVCGHWACSFKGIGTSYPSCLCDLSNEDDGGDESAECNFGVLGKKPTSGTATCCLSRSGSTVSCKCDTLFDTCTSFGGDPVPSCDREFLFESALKRYETSVCSQ